MLLEHGQLARADIDSTKALAAFEELLSLSHAFFFLFPFFFYNSSSAARAFWAFAMRLRSRCLNFAVPA